MGVVEQALHGQEAINKVIINQKQRQYDFIFMDLSMPIMDGFEVSTVTYSNTCIDCEATKEVRTRKANRHAKNSDNSVLSYIQARIYKTIKSITVY